MPGTGEAGPLVMDWLRLPRFGRDTAWLYVSAVIVTLAGIIKLRQGVVDYAYTETHCYQSVRTNTLTEPYVDCFSVSPTGRFSKVFKAEDGTDLARNASSGFAMPGLWDGHGHLLQYGEFLNSVDLFGSTSMGEVRARIRYYVTQNPDAGSKEQWLRGVGWDQMALGKMPTAVSSSISHKSFADHGLSTDLLKE